MSVGRLSRVYELYRRTATLRSALALLVANAVPLVGALFLGWGLWTILVIYWLENGIVGVWNVARIAMAGGALDDGSGAKVRASGRAGLVGFFTMHYGIFWLGHGFFVMALPLIGADSSVPCGALEPGAPDPGFLPFPAGEDCGNAAFGALDWPSIAIAAVVLFLSHGLSFLLNYVGRGEYLRTSPMRQMMAPYGRVVVLHLTIIFGGFLVGVVGAPIGLVVVLVLVKTAIDLGLHLREHRSTDAWQPA